MPASSEVLNNQHHSWFFFTPLPNFALLNFSKKVNQLIFVVQYNTKPNCISTRRIFKMFLIMKMGWITKTEILN